jgi:hypothetical protein
LLPGFFASGRSKPESIPIAVTYIWLCMRRHAGYLAEF